MRYAAAALVAVLGWCVPAFGDASPPAVQADNAIIYTLCSAQTATGDCDTTGGGTGDELVATLIGAHSVVFLSHESTATAYTCDVYESSNGHDGVSGNGSKANVNSITETAKVLELDGTFHSLWVSCPTITGGNVTIKAVATRRGK